MNTTQLILILTEAQVKQLMQEVINEAKTQRP